MRWIALDVGFKDISLFITITAFVIFHLFTSLMQQQIGWVLMGIFDYALMTNWFLMPQTTHNQLARRAM